jgi:TonB family protein
MKSIYEVGVQMIALMILVCPPALGQNDSQDKAAAEAKPRTVSITLKSGEVINGLLIKIDENSVEYKVNDVVQSKSMQEVSHIRFSEETTSTAKTGSTISVSNPSTPGAGADPATRKQDDQQTSAQNSLNLRPAILRKEKAGYTDEARRNGVQGIVVLSAVFAADGTVKSIKVVRGLPDGLNESAIEAAKKIRFRPAIKDGKPVSVRGNIEFSFNIDLTLPAPRLLLPPPNEIITTGLRKTTLHWDPVPGALRYKVRLERERDKPGKWTLHHETQEANPYYDFNFTDADVWRWRVKTINAFGREGDWSDWRTLRFTK